MEDSIQQVQDKLLTSKQVAQQLNISPRLLDVKKDVWKNILPRITFPGCQIIRYRQSDVNKIVQNPQSHREDRE